MYARGMSKRKTVSLTPRQRSYGEGTLKWEGPLDRNGNPDLSKTGYWKARITEKSIIESGPNKGDIKSDRRNRTFKDWREAQTYLDDIAAYNKVLERRFIPNRMFPGTPAELEEAKSEGLGLNILPTRFIMCAGEVLRQHENEVKNGNRSAAVLAKYRGLLDRMKDYFDWLPADRDKTASVEDVIDCLTVFRNHLQHGVKRLGNMKKFPDRNQYEYEADLRGINYEDPKWRGRVLSVSLRRNIVLLLKMVFTVLQEQNVIPTYPYFDKVAFDTTVSLPPVEEVAIPERRAKIIIQYLIDLVKNEEGCQHKKGICAFRWLLALEGGHRQSECLALDIEDFEMRGTDYFYSIKRHFRVIGYKHGCGAKDEEGKWPCGRKAGSACPHATGGIIIVDGTKPGRTTTVRRALQGWLLKAYQLHMKHWTTEREEVRIQWKAKEIPNALHAIHKKLIAQHRFIFLMPPGDEYSGKFIGHRYDYHLWHEIQRKAFRWAAEGENVDALLRPTDDEVLMWCQDLSSVHSCRHYAASNYARMGVNPSLLMNMLGHKNLATTMRYTHTTDDDLMNVPSILSVPVE